MRWFLFSLLAVVSIAFSSCGSETFDEPGDVMEMLVVSGDGQSAPPGTELPKPLVVRVVDRKGRKVEGQIVNFRVVAGGGSVFAGAAITNKAGIAQERWTLGLTGPQRVEARAVDTKNGTALVFAVFNATVLGAAPTVTIDQAASQPDPTTESPILFSVHFSEPVTGFTGSDVSFAGSTVGGTLVATVAGSGADYTVSVTGMVGTGNVVVSIPAGAAVDADANPSAASTSTDNTVTFLDPAPTVTIDQAPSQPDPTNASPINFSVVFSEPVTGFDASDVDLSASSLSGLAASVSGSGAIYTVSVTGMSGMGTVVASIAANAAVDSSGQPSAASTSTDNTVTFVP